MVRLAKPPKRGVADDRAASGGGFAIRLHEQFAILFAYEKARRNRIHADLALITGAQLNRQPAGQVVDRRFRGPVTGVPRQGAGRCHRGDVHDRAIPSLDHGPPEDKARQQGAGQVQVDHLLERGPRHPKNIAAFRDGRRSDVAAGGIDQCGDRSPPADDHVTGRLERIAIEHAGAARHDGDLTLEAVHRGEVIGSVHRHQVPSIRSPINARYRISCRASIPLYMAAKSARGSNTREVPGSSFGGPAIPSESIARTAAPRLEASSACPAATGRPMASAIICIHAGELNRAAPLATSVVAPGITSSSRRSTRANSIATASRPARAMSSAVVAEVMPAIAPNAWGA